MKSIYLDNAATTPTDQRVIDAMLPYFNEQYANPESLHQKGIQAKVAVDKARETIARHLDVRASEIIFTSSGTESNNLALLGFARFHARQQAASLPPHIITTQIEHSSILESCKQLEKEGFAVTYLKPDQYGLISPESLNKAITDNTILVSIIFANNEIGTIQDISTLHSICQSHNIPLHTDACQSPQNLSCELMSINASKIYGPKGIGALYVKSNIKLAPLIHGGDQEFKKRAGTHNVPAIIGFAKVIKILAEEKNNTSALRDKLIQAALEIPDTILNGHPTQRLSNNINLSFKDIDGRELLHQLDNVGICASTGSACFAHDDSTSHVIKAIDTAKNYADGTIRLSLGRQTTEEDIDYTIENLTKILHRLRQSRHR